uniref:RING-type domain-containing protein n=1 Tax=Lates calcarifer TaxID=8187 RepID=A0A4W6D3F4_LATCA
MKLTPDAIQRRSLKAPPIKEDLSCPVCHDIFKDPVVLSCSHSFCRDCLKNWWSEKPTQDCPVCNRRSSKSDPPVSLVIKNLCETFLTGERSESFSRIQKHTTTTDSDPFMNLSRSDTQRGRLRSSLRSFTSFYKRKRRPGSAALREEEELKSQMMKEKIEALSREIAALSHTIRATEEELRAEDSLIPAELQASLRNEGGGLLHSCDSGPKLCSFKTHPV